MAERVYRKRSAVGVQSPTAFGSAPFTQGGHAADAAIGASRTSPPTVSMQGSGQRVYRRKATATQQTPKRTYAIRPEVKAQKLQAWFADAESTIRSAQDYVTKNKDKYNREYGREYSEKVSSLLESADTVAAYIDGYKGDAEAYGSLNSAFSEIRDYLSDFHSHTAAMRDYYSQWDDETGYRDALAATKKREELLGVDTDKLASDIQFTEGLIDLINQYRDWESKDPKYYHNEAGLGAAEIGGNLYGLEQRMAYYGISPDDKKPLEQKLAADKSKYSDVRDAQVLDVVGKAQSDPDYVHHVNTGAAMKKSTFDNYDKIAGEMTQEQKQNYNYLLSKYGKEDADRYFKMVQSEIQSNRATDFYKKHLEDTWYEGLFSVVQGLDQASTGLQSALGNKHTDDRLFDPQMVGAMARENLGEQETPLWYNFKEGKWESKAFGSTLGQIAYDFGSTTANMVPAIGLGAASNLIVPGAGAYVTPALLGISSGGNAYKDALSRGYTEQQARTYGVLVGSSEALLGKVLGSIGPAGKSLTGTAIQGATSGIKSAGARFALQLGGEMLSEAAEEGLQEILTPFFENIALDADNTWEDIDWEQATYSALMGALSAGLLEGAVTPLSSVVTQSARQNAQYRTLGQQFISGENGVNIDAAIAIGLDNAKGTDAYNAAVKLQQKVKAGETVSPYAVGRMVAESQTEQAQTACNIERTVLNTAKEMNIPTDAAETVSAAAVSLGQKVEFVSPEGMHNRYMAGEYDSSTDTVRLNAAERNVDKLIGAVLAHEMVHTAEGTDQLQKLAQIAERMENHKNGAGAWEKLQADVKNKYAAADKQLSDPEVKKEALAHWIAENLFQNKAFAQAVVDGEANVGNAFFYMIDRVRRAMGAKKASAGNLAMLERLFMQAIDARTHGGGSGVQGALNFNFARQYDQWDKKDPRVTFVVGTTSDALRSLGVADKPITWDSSKIIKIKSKHSAMTDEIIKRVPEVLENPVTVMKSRQSDSRWTMFGELYAENKPVLVVLELNPTGKSGIELDELKVVSTYPKDGAQRFMDNSTVLYVTSDKKRISSWEKRTGLQLPVGLSTTDSDTSVAQNAPDVNTQSMQEGAGISAQGALLSPESMEAVRNGTWREARAEGADPNANVEGDNPSVTADAATPPFTQGRHTADAANGADLSVDEAAVLDTALRSQLQGRKQVDVSDLKKTNRRGQTHHDHDAAIDRLETELGKDEMLRRMYNATRMDRPKGIVEVDGRQVDAGAYMDAYERQLPDDVATLEQTVRYLEKQRAEEILRMEREGKLEGYTFGGLKLDLQLFAAKRKYDLLQLDPGESGTEVRQFYEKRLRGTDANHNDELVEMLSGRTETYNPICNEETLADAKKYLDSKKNEDSLLQRIGEHNNDDLFDAKEVAAATVLINRAINDGDLGEAADMIIGLSRKGTIAGRAVQAYSMMARMTPEGTLKAAIRTMRAEADTIICKGASEKLDVLADDIVKAIEEAEDNGLSSKEIIDRIRKGVVGKDAPVQFDHVPQDLADQVSEATGTDVTGYTIVVSTDALQAIVDGGANVETLVDTDAENLQIIVRDGTDIGTIETATVQQLTEGKKRLPAKLTREELVQLLSEDLAAEKGNFFTQEEIYDLLWKTVNEAANVPEQVKRYVLKKIRKDDGGLAQRIYELHKRGDLKQVKLRRAMEDALELPHLTDEDLKWVVEKATEIQALDNAPVKQADAMDELYDYLGAKMHVSTLEMLAAWRKFSMLFNAKTHLRNIFSNLAYMGVRKMDSAIAMAIERVFVRDRNQWGAALGWSHTEHGKNLLPQLQKQAELAVLEMQNRGPKYEQGTGQLKRHRKMFGTSKLGEKVNATSDWNSDMLEAEDIKFFRPAYIDALGQLMTARGVTEITTELHDIAMQRALEATFRNRNYISEWMSAPRRGLNSDKKFVRVMASLYDVAIPFVNTPAAVAEQSIWHTPIGIVKGAFDLYNATKGKGTKDIATAINTLSKGITGTALFAIGILLGNAGLFHVGFGRTDKERAADEMEGLQDGALVIGGASISLDWLQPAASPLIVGASLATNKREKGWSLSTVFGAVFDGTDSLFELTMLQSLYDILGGYEAGPSGSLASIGENYVGQSTPTLLGQLARAIDPVQRKTKGDNAFETAVNQVMAKIPGLTYLLDPELDVWGNEVYRTGKASTGSAAWNAIQQFVSPANAKIGTGKDDPISQEILRLYNTLDTSAVIPSEITYDEAAEIGEERVDLNRLLGGINRLAVEEFVGNEKAYAVMVETGKLTEKGNPQTKRVTKYYRDMTDDERRRVLSNIYKNTKAEVTGDTEGKTESQLTDSERYFRNLIRRVQNGERGTYGAAEPTREQRPASAQQENTSYYADLLRRMKNGN